MQYWKATKDLTWGDRVEMDDEVHVVARVVGDTVHFDKGDPCDGPGDDEPVWMVQVKGRAQCFLGNWTVHPQHTYPVRFPSATMLCPGHTPETVMGYRPGVTKECATLAEWAELEARMRAANPGHPGQ